MPQARLGAFCILGCHRLGVGAEIAVIAACAAAFLVSSAAHSTITAFMYVYRGGAGVKKATTVGGHRYRP